jgi:hypothetical protein
MKNDKITKNILGENEYMEVRYCLGNYGFILKDGYAITDSDIVKELNDYHKSTIKIIKALNSFKLYHEDCPICGSFHTSSFAVYGTPNVNILCKDCGERISKIRNNKAIQ